MSTAVRDLRLDGHRHARQLEDTLHTELRLLTQLDEQLCEQRSAVAHHDAGAIHDSVHASARVLLTLEEARSRRRQLCTLLFGDSDVAPADIPGALGPAAESDLAVTVDALMAQAERVTRTIAGNRRLLQGALRTGQELIRVLQGEPAGGLVYERRASPALGTSGGLLNRSI